MRGVVCGDLTPNYGWLNAGRGGGGGGGGEVGDDNVDGRCARVGSLAEISVRKFGPAAPRESIIS